MRPALQEKRQQEAAATRIQAAARGRAVRTELEKKRDAARAAAIRSGGRRRSSVRFPAQKPLITPPTGQLGGLGQTQSFKKEEGEARLQGDQIESALDRVEEAVGLEPDSMGAEEDKGDGGPHDHPIDEEAERRFLGVEEADREAALAAAQQSGSGATGSGAGSGDGEWGAERVGGSGGGLLRS